MHNGYKTVDKAKNHAQDVIDDAIDGKRKTAKNYHGRLGEAKELDILSNPDAVYLSQGKEANFIFRQGDDIVVTQSGSGKGSVITSYGPSGPRGDSGVASLGGGLPTDPGAAITHGDIIGGNIPTPSGGTLAPADQILP